MKKVVSVLMSAALLITAVGFSGCDIGNSATKDFDFGLDTSQNVELTIVGGMENFEALELVVSNFEAIYTNCSITYEYINEYEKNLKTRLENDSANTHLFLSAKGLFQDDDADFYSNNTIDMGDYANVGIDVSATRDVITSSQEVEGKLYLVPLAMNMRGVVVNKDLLKKYNVEIPQNWSEFVAACETLKSNGLIPIQCNPDGVLLNLLYPNVAVSLVKDAESEAKLSALNSFTEGSGEYLRTFFDKALLLMEKGYISAEENSKVTDSYEQVILNFFEGDVAFSPCSTETVSGMKKRETKSEAFTANPFEYEFMASPSAEDGVQAYWQVWNCISVTKGCNNENWARAFANYLVKEENLQLLAKTKGMPANTDNTPDDARFESLFGIDEAHTTEATKFQIAFYGPLINTFKNISSDSTAEGYVGDIDAALANFEKEIAAKKAG